VYLFSPLPLPTTTQHHNNVSRTNSHLLAADRQQEYGFDQIRQVSAGRRLLLPHFLRAAVRALVVLYVVRSGGCDPHALAVEPPLADVAADPELVRVVQAAAGPAEGLGVLLVVFVVVIIVLFGSRSCCSRVLHVAVASSLYKQKV
jgi:hypothetical protein